jgi:hypothetical protein
MINSMLGIPQELFTPIFREAARRRMVRRTASRNDQRQAP